MSELAFAVVEVGSMKIRALFSGACNGDWKNVFTRVAKINDKKGPFDVLFCFGNFFTASGAVDGDILDDALLGPKKLLM